MKDMITFTRSVGETKVDHLKEGRCPNHGIRMTQVASQYLEETDRDRTVFACPRRNCGIRARAHTLHGPWILISE